MSLESLSEKWGQAIERLPLEAKDFTAVQIIPSVVTHTLIPNYPEFAAE